MCAPHQVFPVYVGDVADGTLNVSWLTGREADGSETDWAYTAGVIRKAISDGRPVHLVGLQTFGSDPSAPLGYMWVAVDDLGRGRVMDPALITSEDTTDVRIRLRSQVGIKLTIDGAGAVSEGVLGLLIEVEGECP